MEKQNEKIIEKIKKVLELSRNNPSAEEAKSAALKAQKMMSEYHISMKEVEAIEDVDNIIEKRVYVGTGNKWKYTLAAVIAKNFRCKYFLVGKQTIVFYGYETDTEIATATFEMLFKSGNRLCINFYQRQRQDALRNYRDYDGRGIKNAFLEGYIIGIKEVLDEQCTVLMLIVPKEVEQSYSDMSSGFKRVNTSFKVRASANGANAKTEGIKAGRNTATSRHIAMA